MPDPERNSVSRQIENAADAVNDLHREDRHDWPELTKVADALDALAEYVADNGRDNRRVLSCRLTELANKFHFED